MKLKTPVEFRLENDKDFRERRNKDIGLARILMAKYPGLMYSVQESMITVDSLVAAFQDYSTMDRAWRKTLEERPELRGSDYNDKDKLETDKMTELGYKTANLSQNSANLTPAAEPEIQKPLL